MIKMASLTRRKQKREKTMTTNQCRPIWLAALAALGTVTVGCGSPSAPAPVPTPPSSGTASANDVPDLSKYADAGLGAKIVSDPKKNQALFALAFQKYGQPRSDPFALQKYEKDFDTQQTEARVFQETGGFTNIFAPTVIHEPQAIPYEEQPYRRLAGVVVGDSVVALISMSNSESYIIYPGEQLPAPYSQWRVKSIDMDKAVLERNSGNPRDVVVRLELPREGTTGAPGAGGPAGGPPGGFPGAPGGGRPPGFGGTGFGGAGFGNGK